MFSMSTPPLPLGVYKQWTGLLEWWNSGLEGFCSYFHYLSCCIYFVVLADLCYTFCVAGFPDFEDY